MADHPPPSHPPTEPPSPRPQVQPATGPPRGDGRCDQCGYSLVGLRQAGTCPECGSAYSDQSARRLAPWPSAGMLCLRLGWPLAGLLLVTAVTSALRNDAAGVTGLFTGWALAIALPVNTYFQVRSMLKKSLPHQKRTRGPVLAMRAIGTTLCVLVFVGLLAPFIFLVGCLIAMSGGDWGH